MTKNPDAIANWDLEWGVDPTWATKRDGIFDICWFGLKFWDVGSWRISKSDDSYGDLSDALTKNNLKLESSIIYNLISIKAKELDLLVNKR